MSTCTAYCVAKNFNFQALKEAISGRNYCSIYRDVIHIGKDPGDIFIFSYGVLVFWGTSREAFEGIINQVRPFEQEPFQDHLSDEFTFSVSGGSKIRDDHISLATEDVEEKLAISHGIAQSVKLEEFELSAEKTIAETAHIPINMALAGKSRLTRRQISMMRAASTSCRATSP